VKAALLVLGLSFLGAPFQCASDPDPARRMEDTPSEALWNLSERFHERGEQDACEATLREIIRAYPNSREAERARLVLEQAPAPDSADEAPGGGEVTDTVEPESEASPGPVPQAP